MEPRSRAIAEAIENGELPHGREDGQTLAPGDRAAYERRHCFGRDLKAWMEKAFPNEKPAFLFDDVERNSHTAISTDAYRAIIAERDKLKSRLEDAANKYLELRAEKQSVEGERDSLKAMVEKAATPGPRTEATYQNIIAALLDCIDGNLPGVERHPSFANVSQLIDAIDQHFTGYGGLSRSNLSRKFPEAKRALQSR
ncbi:MAG: protein kinase [Haliea sp.]|nr:protein kinase [Haliea sp.]